MKETSVGSTRLPDAAERLGLAFDRPWEQTIQGARVWFGPGRLEEIGGLAAGLGGRRVLLVTDDALMAAGHGTTAIASLEAAGLTSMIFHAVDENPTDENVAAGVVAATHHEADLLVALGGGSPMDCCKAINFVYTNGGEIGDYEGLGESPRPLLPSVGVPTTAGTGSEAQSYALITDSSTHRKMACGDPGARFGTVILDPILTATMPRATAAASSLDAVAHAVESYVSRRRCETSIPLSLLAWEILDGAMEIALGSPSNPIVWGAMQIGSYLAGAAIEASMLGAAHSCANPLTAEYGTIHGVAVALMLPSVVRYNAANVSDLYAQLLAARPGGGEVDSSDAGEQLALRLESLREAAGLPASLRDIGIPAGSLDRLAEAAEQQWTLEFNPRAANQADLRGIYEAAF